jgi:CDP-2,3-bis-(O-geranylgeranyl)-sn-glycerol synthase
LFGSHKTWRGIIAGILASGAVFAIQQVLVDYVPAVRQCSFLEYDRYSWLLGTWMGAGALMGDLLKSLVKRRVGIPPGHTWFPFDQLDWILGTLLFTYPFVNLPGAFIAVAVLVGFVLHLVAKVTGYALRLNRDWI